VAKPNFKEMRAENDGNECLCHSPIVLCVKDRLSIPIGVPVFKENSAVKKLTGSWSSEEVKCLRKILIVFIF
jgi:hypothetical protein